MSSTAWLLLAIAYLALLIILGLTALRRGHTFLFFVGLFLPLFWVVGAFMPPTATAAARANVR